MLKKLLKYDLENIFKFLSVFYILAVVFAVFTRVFFAIENSFIMNIIAQVFSGATIAMIFNIVINCLMRSWVRFKQNLYGDESYLTHTLPVEKKTLYFSKIITATVALFASVAVIGAVLFVAYYSKENLELLKNTLLPVADAFDSSVIGLLLILLFVLFLEFANILQCGLTGMIIGHKFNSNKIVRSLLYGFIVYMLSQGFVLLCTFIVGLFNKSIMNLFFTEGLIDLSYVKMVAYIAMGVYALVLIILCFVNIKLFKKGVNVD